MTAEEYVYDKVTICWFLEWQMYGKAILSSPYVVHHTSFYAKTWVLYKDRTPGSDPVKGGLSKGSIVEVDLENNSQNTQPILTL